MPETLKSGVPIFPPDLTPAVSFIVPCRNEKDHIETCVRSLLRQEPPPGDFEIIVADGMSDDGTRDILKRLAKEDSRLRIIDNPHLTISAGLNSAIRVARGGIIARMDAHTECAPDYIRECLAVLQETGADLVGGPWVATGKGFVGKAIAAAFQSAFAVGGARGHDPSYEGEIDAVYLGCWRREVCDRIGLFDEELVRSEDDEFELRLIRAGGKVWQSRRIKSWYSCRDSLRSLFQQNKHNGYWKIRVMRKHKRQVSVRHLIPGGFVLLIIVLPLISLWWPLALSAWLSLISLYAIGNLTASLVTAAQRGWGLLPILPLVFACYHIPYGYGFLLGVLDFIVLKRGPRNSYTKLIRSSMS
jgi:glycosyltransferase involved in cell wall biosynthesis